MRQVLFLCLFLTSSLASLAYARINTPGLSAIYGVDDRELISTKSDPKIQEMARAVALIVSVERMDVGMFKTKINASTVQEELNMCASEHFVNRPAIPGCTGFLVGPNVMVSAGHCFVNEDDCSNKKIIFDVDAQKQTKKGYSVSNSSVFSCKKIINTIAMDQQDYSIIELDRVAKKRQPLKLNMTSKIDNKAQVFMIGHPLGMPLMLSKATSVANNNDSFQFTAGLDSFEGNSGSPVINAKTLQVEGILVNGQQDLVQDLKIQCYRNVVYSGAGGEGVFRISELAPYLK